MRPKRRRPTPDEIRAELMRRNEEHATEYYMALSEAEMLQLAAGIVPKTVRAMAASMLDWSEEDAVKALSMTATA